MKTELRYKTESEKSHKAHDTPLSFGEGGDDREVPVNDVDKEARRRSERLGRESAVLRVLDWLEDTSLSTAFAEGAADGRRRGRRIFSPVDAVLDTLDTAFPPVCPPPIVGASAAFAATGIACFGFRVGLALDGVAFVTASTGEVVEPL